MSDPTCELSECDAPRYQTRSMCASHYMRNWRYGDPRHRPKREVADLHGIRFGMLTAIERRDGVWLCRCDCGADTRVRIGDLKRGSVTSCGDRRTHGRRTIVTTSGAHSRVRAERGPARDHPCVDCQSPAAHWSYDHGDANERVDPTKGPYSMDPARYQARCVPCHKRFDLDHLSTTRQRVEGVAISTALV